MPASPRYGDLAARAVKGRIAEPAATSTTLKALPAEHDSRTDGALTVKLDDSTLWIFDLESTVAAQDGVLVPDAGSGRWLQVGSGGGTTQDVKASVVAATTGALAANTRTGNVLLADANGALGAIDGVTLVAGTSRLFVKNEATGANNGLYLVDSLGSAGTKWQMTRAVDADTSAKVTSGMVVVVSEGTANADTAWKLDTNDPITLNTTALTFTQIPFGFGAAAALENVSKAAEVAGTSNLAARVDHKHDIDTATAVDTGEAASAEGSSANLARADHVHKAHPYEVRYAMTTNVAALATFTVLQDGVTGVAGDLVLLANQTTGAESGIYVLGTVAGTAPLTRVAWLPTAAVVRGGFTVHVNEGTLNGGSSWFISTAGAVTIGTTAHLWFPERITQSLALVAGTTTITNVPVLSVTKTGWAIARRIANTSSLTTGGYHPTVAGANGVTAGVVGTASVVVEATVAAGTINNVDISTLEITVINR